jgi:hypothetical protein
MGYNNGNWIEVVQITSRHCMSLNFYVIVLEPSSYSLVGSSVSLTR